MKKLMRKKLALLLASQNKKRPYYCEVEYLESTGTQYIDTGLLSTANSKVDIVYGFTSMEGGAANNCAIFGGRNNSTTNTFTFFKIASQTPQYFRFDYNNQFQMGNATQLTWNTTSKYRFSYNGSVAKAENTTTGETYSTNLSPASTFTTSSITLFAVNTNDTAGQFMKGRIYKYWYTDGINTIDLIPVLDWNMTPCMYDRITKQLFYNAGTGDFVAGREIHYIDYLENITSQASLNYIPTKYTPTTNTNLEAKVRYTGGASGATWAIGAATWWGIHYQGQGPKIGITNSSIDPYQVYTPYTAGNDITLKLDGSNVYANGTLIGSLTKQNASSTLSLFRYSTSANLSWVGRIYYLDIWDNNGDVFKFRPAIDETGKGYLFDQVSHTIYDNAGTGNFAYPPVRIEWVQTDGVNSYIDTNEKPPSGGLARALQIKVATLNVFQNSPIFGNAQSDGQVCWGLEYYNSSYSYGYAATKKSYPIHFTPIITAGSSPVEWQILILGTLAIIGGYSYDVSAEEYQGTQNNTTICLGRLGPNIIPSAEARNRFYYAQILNTFVPVFKDGKAGMLNTRTNEFCGNAGTGTIVGGPIIESG